MKREEAKSKQIRIHTECVLMKDNYSNLFPHKEKNRKTWSNRERTRKQAVEKVKRGRRSKGEGGIRARKKEGGDTLPRPTQQLSYKARHALDRRTRHSGRLNKDKDSAQKSMALFDTNIRKKGATLLYILEMGWQPTMDGRMRCG